MSFELHPLSGLSLNPFFDGDVSQLYWQSNIPTMEIAEAYGLCHAHHVCAEAGPATVIGLSCRHCSGPIAAYSRSDALRLSQHKAKTEKRGWEYTHVCADCADRDREIWEKEWRDREAQHRTRVRSLASMPYGEYLQTQEWQETRKAALKRAKFSCQTCAGKGVLHVHHRTYARRGNEYASDLIVLCADCHSLFHQNARLAEGGRAA